MDAGRPTGLFQALKKAGYQCLQILGMVLVIFEEGDVFKQLESPCLNHLQCREVHRAAAYFQIDDINCCFWNVPYSPKALPLKGLELRLQILGKVSGP